MKAQIYKILPLVLSVLLLLSLLFGCAPELTEEQVKEETLDYLSSRYSADFLILSAVKKSTAPGPIPQINIFNINYYWELKAEATLFAEDTFTIYYKYVEDTGEWEWTDNYYSLLLDNEAKRYFENMISFDTDYLVEVEWGYYPLPDRTDETTTFLEWLDAGGEIFSVDIYLNNIDPSETQCTPIAEYILSSCPNLHMVYFGGITTEGFEQVQREGWENIDWNEHNDWQLDYLMYFQEDTSTK